MSSSTNYFTETLFKNSRPETSVNSYLNNAVKDSREKGSHEKFRTVLFHEYPPDTLESINDQRGKAAAKETIDTRVSYSVLNSRTPFSIRLLNFHRYPPHISTDMQNNGECKTKCGNWFSK